MSTSEPFTLVESEGRTPPRMFTDYKVLTSRKTSSLDVQMLNDLRSSYPDMIVTSVPSDNVNLLQFAAAGHATAELDSKDDDVVRWRGFIPPRPKGREGFLADATMFAKYHYKWNNEDFILYNVLIEVGFIQYILKEPRKGETTRWLTKDVPGIWVYDGLWSKSTKMYEEVQKASWDDVILDKKMKDAVTSVAKTFFDSRDVYEKYGVPWKRGVMFYGPPGNGKTISIKALMHTLNDRNIPCLYVKSARYTYQISMVFRMARQMSPCLLILEDIDTIVTPSTRSYFFNEVDGLENNDGILMIASTNHLDQLDPGLSKRPSRFDRKYLFPLPNKDERTLYCQYWRNKLKNKEEIEFPKSLCGPMAAITDRFSFAYLKEAFVSTLLEIARNHTDNLGIDADVHGLDSDDFEGLDKYELWRYFKEQVRVLKDEMGNKAAGSSVGEYGEPMRGGRALPVPGEMEPPFEPTSVSRGEDIGAGSNIGTLPHRPIAHGKATATSEENVDRKFFQPLALLASQEEEGCDSGLRRAGWF